MPDLNRQEVERYLQSVVGPQAIVTGLKTLGGGHDIKGYGYGTPIAVDYQLDRQARRAVLHTISPGPFGHEHMADRAQELIWENRAFNLLPRHVRSFDVCGFHPDGRMVSIGDVEEFCLLTDYVEGNPYSLDLERLRDTGDATALDLQRADALCDYLVDIHSARGADPGLYTRRIRELVGSNECIMGIADSYPANPLIQKIERLCVDWRWRLKPFTHRLRQVHGDFHPWNILFREGADFSVLDRSRGEFGDPADDVASLTMNYLFFSLRRSGRLEGNLESLFQRFWSRYLEKSYDSEMRVVAAPFFAFRGLVMASPVWYPTLPETVRKKILNFIVSVLETDRFDPKKVNDYCG